MVFWQRAERICELFAGVTFYRGQILWKYFSSFISSVRKSLESFYLSTKGSLTNFYLQQARHAFLLHQRRNAQVLISHLFHTKSTHYWSLLHSAWRSLVSVQFIIKQWHLLFLQYYFMSKQSTPGNLSPGFLPTEGPTPVPVVYRMFFRRRRVLPDEKPVKAQEKPAVILFKVL